MALAHAEDLGERQLLDDAVAAQTVPPVRIGRHSLPARLFAEPALHHILPDQAGLALAAAAGRAAWRVPKMRERALAQMSLLLAGTGRERETEALARAQLVELALRAEMMWRPWMWGRVPVRGIERVLRVRAEGRGGILLTAHSGFTYLMAAGLREQRLRLNWVVGEWARADLDGYSAYYARALRRSSIERGVPLLRAAGSYGLLRELLARGEFCFLALDCPGPVETKFLEKPARLTGGVAHLALDTGVPMIPMFTARDGLKPFVEVREPVEPDAFRSVEELVQHLADVVGAALLERPETVDFVTGHAAVWPRDSGPYRWAFT